MYATGITSEGKEIKFRMIDGEINCFRNNLISLDLSKCKNLERLYCFGNYLTVLDLSNCEKIGNVKLW